ncbi:MULTISPECIES: phosphoethanolamine transferase [Rodentibacter]|uniref:phosphoethanolamine transferase n=1 Tax=Rodentibacter TaxID=1960084 RepID=UPI001CFC6757|nr:sulfatase-like hydrolase/transferase [Rodentibacter sp. JRC1]GJI56046.1 sulfatase [Rodentibacter sp. JRC1]
MFKNVLNRIFYPLIFSLILFCTEILYRKIFNTADLDKYVETYFFILAIVSIFYFSKYKLTKFLIATFFTLSIMGNSVHYQVYQSWLNGVNMFLFLKEFTEVKNAGISMIQDILPHFLFSFLEILIFLSILFFNKHKKSPTADFLFFSLIIYISVRAFRTSTLEHYISPNPGYSRVKVGYLSTGYFLGRVLPYEIFSLSDIPLYHKDKPEIVSVPEIDNIILIVGESVAASHLNVLGYERETTPYLNKIKDQVLIKPTYSSGLFTAVALPSFFNAIPYPNGLEQILKGNTNLFRLAKERRYKTYFYSAQPEDEMAMMNFLGQAWIDEQKFPTQLGYKKKEGMADEKLLDFLPHFDLTNNKNFIVLHHRGSHLPYGYYLDENDKPFGEKTTIDKYDNTILKFDQFYQTVFEYLKKQTNQGNYLLIYISDHGQKVLPDGNRPGTFDEDNYIVPLVVYSNNPKLHQKIINEFNKCEISSHNQIATFLIQTMGYKMDIQSCYNAVVNSNVLTGDAGYLKINNGIKQFILPNQK